MKVLEDDPEKKEKVMRVTANDREVAADFFKTYIMQTLNNAEYFAMSFTHKTADESVIYQSIYPTFLEMCFVMYYFISQFSDPSKAKLYTNIAELYCMWRKREQEQISERNEGARKGSNKKGTVISDN